MAKFFKEDLNKRKKRNKEKDNENLQEQSAAEEVRSEDISAGKEERHGPGSLIADLNNLGKDKHDEFLKGFPKTPAELAAEKAELLARQQAAERAAAEAARIAEEENQRTLAEAEKIAIEAAEKMTSGEVKTPMENIATQKESFLDYIEHSQILIKTFFKDFAEAMRHLGHCMWCEIEFSVITVRAFGRALRSVIRDRIINYYKKNPEKKKKRRLKNIKFIRQIRQTKNDFIIREKAAASKMAGFISHVDNKNEKIADKTTELVTEGNKKFNFAREWAEINKRKLLIHMGAVLIVVLCGVAAFNYCTAFEYSYNGRTLGLVKKQEDVLKIVDIVSEQLSKEHSAEIYIDKEQDIAFKRVSALNKDIDDTEDVLNRLTYMKNMNAKAYGMYIGDTRVAIVDSENTADTILQYIKDMYVNPTAATYEEIDFKEDIKVRQIDTKLGRIQNPDTVIQKLLTGAVYQQTHVVVAGDTLSGIGKAYGMTISELREANPDINPERLSIGQEILLTKPAPMVTIKTVEVATYMEPIPYETEYQDTNSLYKGETSTKVKGVNGERNVTARITKENGIQIAADILDAEVLSNPVTEVVIRGTKELPPLQGTGSLRYPVSGYRLTSKFGSRWGRMHYGIDLACPTGTRIGASDGGTVIYSGYSGSYGYVVKIDHGGGVVTVYAHCSKLFVKKGDKVYQGQHIANVGSTGRSTGPHCHFEVQINGVQKNPLNYI